MENGFFRKQHLDHIVQKVSVFRKDIPCGVVALVEDTLHFGVDFRGGFGRHCLLIEIASQKHFVFGIAEIYRAERAHTPFGNHLSCDGACALNIVACARRDVFDDDFFGDASRKHHCDFVHQLSAGNVVVVVHGTGDGIACRLSARYDGNLVDFVAVFKEFRNDCVSAFVIRGDAFVSFADDAALFLRTRDDLIDTFVDIAHRNDLSVVARAKDCRLVQKVFDVRAGEARSKTGKRFEIDVGGKRFVPCVNLEYFFPAANVGDLYVNLTVETAGAQQCGVENIRAVGCRHNDNAVVLFKAVHLDKQLVERLFALVVTAAQARAALSADRVDFVDENDARHIVFRLVEQVAHTRRADADEHFDKVTAAYAEKRHVRLACDRFCKQRFTGARRTYEQNALGNSRADIDELFGVFKEFHDFLQFFLFFFRAGDVRKTHLNRLGNAGFGLSEVHRLLVLSLALTINNVHHDTEKHNRQYGQKQAVKKRAARGIVVRNLGGRPTRVALTVFDHVVNLLNVSVGNITKRVVLIREILFGDLAVVISDFQNVVAGNLNIRNFACLYVFDKRRVAYLARAVVREHRRDKHDKHKTNQKNYYSFCSFFHSVIASASAIKTSYYLSLSRS